MNVKKVNLKWDSRVAEDFFQIKLRPILSEKILIFVWLLF